jgi:hypothetical protein
MLMQVAPSHARSRNPENPIQDEAVISRAPPAARSALNHERLKTGPFLIAHQTTDQGSFPKSYLDDVDAPALTGAMLSVGHPQQEQERL